MLLWRLLIRAGFPPVWWAGLVAVAAISLGGGLLPGAARAADIDAADAADATVPADHGLWWDSQTLSDFLGGPHALHNPRRFLPLPRNRLERFKWGEPDHYWKFSGQVNKGLLAYNDGRQTLGYPFVDNAHSSTRLRVESFHRKNERVDVHGIIEHEFTPFSTRDVSQKDRGEFVFLKGKLRKAEVWIDHTKWGRFWFGQGSMSSDNSAKIDLSGTSVIGNSNVEHFAGGQYLRFADSGLLSDVKVENAFIDQDGVGRLVRVRYDTHNYRGFVLSASAGVDAIRDTVDDPSMDAVVRYEHVGSSHWFKSAAAIATIGGDKYQFSGSASVLYKNGVSLTGAVTSRAHSDRNAYYFYGKIGYMADFFDVGRTALSADVYSGGNQRVRGAMSAAWGLQAVQSIDHIHTDVYLGVRGYRYSEPSTEYNSSFGVLTGARTRF
jgi:hypothetical protein